MGRKRSILNLLMKGDLNDIESILLTKNHFLSEKPEEILITAIYYYPHLAIQILELPCCSISYKDVYNKTLLHWSLYSRNIYLAIRLIELGSPLFACARDGWSGWSQQPNFRNEVILCLQNSIKRYARYDLLKLDEYFPMELHSLIVSYIGDLKNLKN